MFGYIYTFYYPFIKIIYTLLFAHGREVGEEEGVGLVWECLRCGEQLSQQFVNTLLLTINQDKQQQVGGAAHQEFEENLV